MGRKISTITLTDEDRIYLETQTRARTIQAQTVNRARILLLRADGTSINDIADKIGINRCSVISAPFSLTRKGNCKSIPASATPNI